MQIQADYNRTNFRAKFLNSPSLREVVEYAKEKGKFDRLNQARKSIDSAFLTRRLDFELYTTPDGYPFAIFTRYTPKKNVVLPKCKADYDTSEPYIFTSKKKCNVLKYGYEMIKKLGNSAPHNNMYKEVVAGSIVK